MKDQLNAYIQGLFTEAEGRSPGNRRLAELKEELLLNTQEKYDDLIAMGKSPEAAYRTVVDGIGDITELINDVIGTGSAPVEPLAVVQKTADTAREEADEDRDEDEEEDCDEDEDEDDGEEGRPPRSRWYALVSGIIWTVVFCAYFSLSFATHAWNVTWLLFIMGIAADNVAKGIFDLRR